MIYHSKRRLAMEHNVSGVWLVKQKEEGEKLKQYKMNDKMRVHSSCLLNRELKNVPNFVPMAMLNENMADINHGQTLKRLNERGGLGIAEILFNIKNEKLSFKKDTQEQVNELNDLISKFEE